MWTNIILSPCVKPYFWYSNESKEHTTTYFFLDIKLREFYYAVGYKSVFFRKIKFMMFSVNASRHRNCSRQSILKEKWKTGCNMAYSLGIALHLALVEWTIFGV